MYFDGISILFHEIKISQCRLEIAISGNNYTLFGVVLKEDKSSFDEAIE